MMARRSICGPAGTISRPARVMNTSFCERIWSSRSRRNPAKPSRYLSTGSPILSARDGMRVTRIPSLALKIGEPVERYLDGLAGLRRLREDQILSQKLVFITLAGLDMVPAGPQIDLRAIMDQRVERERCRLAVPEDQVAGTALRDIRFRQMAQRREVFSRHIGHAHAHPGGAAIFIVDIEPQAHEAGIRLARGAIRIDQQRAQSEEQSRPLHGALLSSRHVRTRTLSFARVISIGTCPKPHSLVNSSRSGGKYASAGFSLSRITCGVSIASLRWSTTPSPRSPRKSQSFHRSIRS